MKKIIAVLFSVMIAVCGLYTVSAKSENLLENPWKKGNAGSINSVTENGETVYIAQKINASYASPAIDIYPAVKKAMGNDDEVTVTVRFDACGEFSSPDGEMTGNITVRAGAVSAQAAEIDKNDFSDLYEGTFFKKIDKSNILANDSVIENRNVTITSQWETYTVSFTVYREDLGENLWGQWNFCLSSLKGYENITSLKIKNTELFAGEAPDEEPGNTDKEPGGNAVDVTPTATADTQEPDTTHGDTNGGDSQVAVKTPKATNAVDPEATPKTIYVKTKGVSNVDTVLIIVDVVEALGIAALAVLLFIKKKN